MVNSNSELRRLISQGAVEVDGARIEDSCVKVHRDAVIRVGKHRFVRIVDAAER